MRVWPPSSIAKLKSTIDPNYANVRQVWTKSEACLFKNHVFHLDVVVIIIHRSVKAKSI